MIARAYIFQLEINEYVYILYMNNVTNDALTL